MKIKKGVQVGLIQPQVNLALIIANQIWNNLGQELVVTSGDDGQHMQDSLHYQGFGVDLRTRYFEHHEKISAFTQLTRNLGNNFDVIMHDTHIHMEYDPK